MGASFLGDAQVAAYEREWQPRGLRSAGKGDWPLLGPTPTDLQEAIVRTVGRLNGELGTSNSAVLGIGVEIKDGMSWSAEKVAETVRDVGADWELRSVTRHAGEADAAFKQLLELVGDRRAIRRAMRSSTLVPELYRPLPWLAAAAVLAAAVGVTGALLGKLAVGAAAPLSFGVLVLAALALWAANRLTPSLILMPGADVDQRIAKALAQKPEGRESEEEFEAAIVRELDPQRRRIVILEDLEAVSPWVSNVVESYLKKRPGTHEQQIWVLLARARQPSGSSPAGQAEPVNVPALNMLRVDGRYSWWLFGQNTLTKAEKKELLEKRDVRSVSREDDRVRQRTVGRVVALEQIEYEGDQPSVPELDDLSPSELRAFALLAVAARVPDPEAVEAADLGTIARGANSEDAQLTQLLKGWFPEGSQNAPAIESAFDMVSRRLLAQLDQPATGRVRSAMRVRRTFADALCAPAAWAARELPSQDLAHAFWAAYSERELLRRRQWSAPVADRLIWHLRAIKEPTRLRSSGRHELADQLFQTAVDGAEAALALCVDGLVPRPTGDSRRGLYQQARLLLAADADPPDVAHTERLCTSAWLAYQLTGEPALVDSVNGLSADLGTSRPREPTDQLLRLYRETVPGVESTPLTTPRGHRASAAVLDNARIRAIWLGSILAPMIEAKRAPELHAAAATADVATSAILEGALARLSESSDDNTAALDHLTLIRLALCETVTAGREDGKIAQARKRCELILSFSSRRLALGSNPRVRVHYMLDGLLRHLDATARASLALLGPREARSADESRRAALEELENLHVIWHNMELYELADLAALSRATFDVVEHSAVPSTEAGTSAGGDLLVGLAPGGAGAMHRIEVELLVGVARLWWSWPAGSLALLEAANLAIDNGFGSGLATELGRLVLGASKNTSARTQAEQVVAYLLDPPGRPSLLDIVDADLAEVVDIMLAGVTSAGSDVGKRLIQAIHVRNQSVEPDWRKDEIEQIIERGAAFHDDPPTDPEELAKLLERWRGRAWDSLTGTSTTTYEPTPPSYVRGMRARYCDLLSYVIKADLAPSGAEADAAKLLATIDSDERTGGAVQLAFELSRSLERHGGEAAPSVPAEPAGNAGTPTVPIRFRISGPHKPSGGIDLTSSPQVFALALEVQRSAIDAVASTIPPGLAAGVYGCLAAHSQGPLAAKYWAKSQHWRGVNERLTQSAAVFAQYARGRYFEVFWHHFERVPELPIDVDQVELQALLGGPPDRLWDLAESTPDPLMLDATGKPYRVRSGFLRAGHYLFHGEAGDVESDEVKEARRRVNAAAGGAIRGLYQLLVEHPHLSRELHEIYSQQRSRFDQIDRENRRSSSVAEAQLA
jgi:hypothetical protein